LGSGIGGPAATSASNAPDIHGCHGPCHPLGHGVDCPCHPLGFSGDCFGGGGG
jgi:hypothetical protein